jgi:hypothetical protein
MSKRKSFNLDEYLEEATINIRADRAMASSLLIDVIADMKSSVTDRRELGPTAAKYIENLQRSNEQMVKLAALLQKQRDEHFGLTVDDKEQLYDMLKEPEE